MPPTRSSTETLDRDLRPIDLVRERLGVLGTGQGAGRAFAQQAENYEEVRRFVLQRIDELEREKRREIRARGHVDNSDWDDIKKVCGFSFSIRVVAISDRAVAF